MQNGYVPDEFLVEVEPGKFLERATAAAYLDAKRASVGLLRIASPAGAYRSYAVQADMKANPWRYGIDPDLAVNISAPGSSSHGFGTRVDLVKGPARVWADARLPGFGFRKEFGDKDPGHWQFLRPTFASTDTQPLPIPNVLEDDLIAISAPNRGGAVIGPGYYHSLLTEEWQNVDAIVTRKVEGNDRQFDLWREIALGGTATGAAPSVAQIAAAVDGVISDEEILAGVNAGAGGGPSLDAIAARLKAELPAEFVAALKAAL